MKHAPGPWKADLKRMTVSDSIGVIADIHGTTEQDDMNARLIAAAPEMLEALERLEGNDWIGQPTRSMIESALKKARGES